MNPARPIATLSDDALTIEDVVNAAGKRGCLPQRESRKARRRAKYADKKNLALLAGLMGVGLKEVGAEGDQGIDGLGGSICRGHASWRGNASNDAPSGDVSTTSASQSVSQSAAISGRSIAAAPEEVTYTVIAEFPVFRRRTRSVELEFDTLAEAEAFVSGWERIFSRPRFRRFGDFDVTIVPSSVEEVVAAPAAPEPAVEEQVVSTDEPTQTDPNSEEQTGGEAQGAPSNSDDGEKQQDAGQIASGEAGVVDGAHDHSNHDHSEHDHSNDDENGGAEGAVGADEAGADDDKESDDETSDAAASDETADDEDADGGAEEEAGHNHGDHDHSAHNASDQNQNSQTANSQQTGSGASVAASATNDDEPSEEMSAADSDDDHSGHDHGMHDHGTNSDAHANHAHPDDPAKASEHMALLDLVPVAEATHVAVSDGSWFDPSTWAGGEVPGAGAKVVIPSGYTVLYDGESPASLFTVRVDGKLDFATDVGTFMEVDTFVVSPSGALTIGTADNPVDPDVSAVISIADNGDIDVAWDPKLLSRGLISHGSVEIHGAEKENFLKVAADPMAGDTSLTLDGVPEGWQVGDTIVLTGTHLTAVQSDGTRSLETGKTQDEELIITGIDGTTIFFDRPLQYDHDGPRDDLKAYVSNQTRNIRIETENGDALPVHQRGHVMLMHSDDIDVRYAQFDDLGRTDKSVRSVDISDVENVAADSNVQGRYALHIHRSGVGQLDDPAMIVGNTVNGVVGWGIVHHDSHAVIASNNVYDIVGAGFIAEAGNETGRWVDNIAIKAFGVDQLTKDGADVDAFDLGRNGTGFWFQSRMVEAVDNVAAGMPGGQGFVYFSRGTDPFDSKIDPATLQNPSIMTDADLGDTDHAPIAIFSGNEAIAVEKGLEVIKGSPEQNHDARSIISDFTAWETKYGVRVEYTGHYTFKDLDLVGSDLEFAGDMQTYGVFIGNQTIDMAFNGATVDGFKTGFYTEKTLVGQDGFDPSVDPFNYVFIDVDVIGAETDFSQPSASDIFLNSDQLVEGRLDYDPTYDGALDATVFRDGEIWIYFPAEKTDSVGSTQVSSDESRISISKQRLANAISDHGYWEGEDGSLVTVVEQVVADRATGEPIQIGVVVDLGPDLNPFNWYWRNDPEPPTFNGAFDPSNAGPTLVDDAVTVAAGEEITIDVLANDSDPDGGVLELNGLWSERGSVRANDDGTVTYVADDSWSGEDVFRYFVDDGQGNFDYATVAVTIEA